MTTELEPNGSFAQATPVATGVILTGKLASTSDVDVYKVSLAGAVTALGVAVGAASDLPAAGGLAL